MAEGEGGRGVAPPPPSSPPPAGACGGTGRNTHAAKPRPVCWLGSRARRRPPAALLHPHPQAGASPPPPPPRWRGGSPPLPHSTRDRPLRPARASASLARTGRARRRVRPGARRRSTHRAGKKNRHGTARDGDPTRGSPVLVSVDVGCSLRGAGAASSRGTSARPGRTPRAPPGGAGGRIFCGARSLPRSRVRAQASPTAPDTRFVTLK